MYTVIVGAGMTGLSAAYMLAKAGRRCLLLEKKGRVGGLCQSFILDGVTFDYGPHVFMYRPGAEAEEFMMTLLEGEEIIKRRWRFGINNGVKTYTLPMSITGLLRYPWRFKRQMLEAFLKRNTTADVKTENNLSVAQDMIRKFGKSYYEEIFEPMLLKKTLLSGRELHCDWVARVDRDVRNNKITVNDSPQPLLLRILRILYQTYYYPARGFERLPQRLYQLYNKTGQESILECGQLRFTKNQNRVTTVIVNGVAYPVRDLVWTGSINDLNTLLGSSAPRLSYVKNAFVFLTYNQPRYIKRPMLYVYYTSKELIFERVYFPSNIYGNDTRQSSMAVEGICVILNYVEDFDDEYVLRRTIEEVEKVGLFEKRHLRQSRVIKAGQCMPVYWLDYEQDLAAAYKEIHGYKNVYSVGRMGGFYFCMTPAAVSQGFKAATEILKTNNTE
ncbi:MAG: FAD-dependent oxidoreductase [Nitrospirae bacterium]|nr:FAD-dependent oxidoreductase [Nitrospirota bacterium]